MEQIKKVRQIHTNLMQSVWLDFMDHAIMCSGKLSMMIKEDGLCGVNSNPAIFATAIATNESDL